MRYIFKKLKGERMNHNHALKDFIPLAVIFAGVCLLTIALQLFSGNLWTIFSVMRFFMASFFLVFGAFKAVNLAGFASAYAMYDLIAARWYVYGYIYPFIELGLGGAYLLNWNPIITNVITLCIMAVSAVGVLRALTKGEHLMCACLGTLFKIPMTYVTLAEDLLMAGMALFMLFVRL